MKRLILLLLIPLNMFAQDFVVGEKYARGTLNDVYESNYLVITEGDEDDLILDVERHSFFAIFDNYAVEYILKDNVVSDSIVYEVLNSMMSKFDCCDSSLILAIIRDGQDATIEEKHDNSDLLVVFGTTILIYGDGLRYWFMPESVFNVWMEGYE